VCPVPRAILPVVEPKMFPSCCPRYFGASCINPRHERCLLVEIPAPAGIAIRHGATITLRITIDGSSTSLRIPATGHIHNATCNHKTGQRGGAVWRAAKLNDTAALEAALAAGSTEETGDVSEDEDNVSITPLCWHACSKSKCVGHVYRSYILCICWQLCDRSHPHSCRRRCECRRRGTLFGILADIRCSPFPVLCTSSVIITFAKPCKHKHRFFVITTFSLQEGCVPLYYAALEGHISIDKLLVTPMLI